MGLALHLLKGALRRLLVWTPAQELCAVSKAAASEVIVLNFDNEFRLEWLPLGRPLSRPTTGPTRRVARETWRFD
jgi:hypothetical protein